MHFFLYGMVKILTKPFEVTSKTLIKENDILTMSEFKETSARAGLSFEIEKAFFQKYQAYCSSQKDNCFFIFKLHQIKFFLSSLQLFQTHPQCVMATILFMILNFSSFL